MTTERTNVALKSTVNRHSNCAMFTSTYSVSILHARLSFLFLAAPRSDSGYKLAFHDADTDTDTNILAGILADTSDTRDFLKLFL